MNQYHTNEASKAAISLFKRKQAEREQDPRFAEVLNARKRLQYARNMLVDLENTKDALLDIEPALYEMEKSNRQHEINRRQQQLAQAEDEAHFLGKVDVPNQGDGYWSVSYRIDGFVTGTHLSKRFDTVEEAEEFAKQLRAHKGEPVYQIDII